MSIHTCCIVKSIVSFCSPFRFVSFFLSPAVRYKKLRRYIFFLEMENAFFTWKMRFPPEKCVFLLENAIFNWKMRFLLENAIFNFHLENSIYSLKMRFSPGNCDFRLKKFVFHLENALFTWKMGSSPEKCVFTWKMRFSTGICVFRLENHFSVWKISFLSGSSLFRLESYFSIENADAIRGTVNFGWKEMAWRKKFHFILKSYLNNSSAYPTPILMNMDILLSWKKTAVDVAQLRHYLLSVTVKLLRRKGLDY